MHYKLPKDILDSVIKINDLSPEKKERIEEFLEPLNYGEFGDPIDWDYEFWKFPIWVIGKIIIHQKERQKVARFQGEVKLHKIAYFMKNYKFKNLTEFIFESMYFGPYSEDLTKAMDMLIEDGYIKKIENKLKKDRSMLEYELTKKGTNIFLEIDRDMEDRLMSVGKAYNEDILKYIYYRDIDTLSDSAKMHFISKVWEPYLGYHLGKLEEIADMNLLPPEKVQKFMRDLPDERLGILTEYAPYSSFQPDRISFFKSSMIPTNYFIPVNFYKNLSSIVSNASIRYLKSIPNNVTTIVIAYEGISENIAKFIKGKYRPSINVIGPALNYPECDYNIDITNIKSESVVIFANTVQTGRSVEKLIDDLRNENVDIYCVLAFADRGVGAKQLFASKGVTYETYITKKEISYILEWRYQVRI